MSSLLDTFALLFETDAGDAADEVDRLGDSLDGAGAAGDDAARGVKASDKAAADSTATMGGLTKALGGVIAGYLSWQAISAAVFSQAVQTDTLGKFTDAMGLSVAEVDAWGEAVVRSGGSADGFRGSVQSLNEKLGDLALTGGGPAVEVFGRLGISALDSAGRIRKVTDLLPEIADSFQRLTKQESFSFGQRLGLDQGTILLLQQGRNSVEALVEQQRQLGGRTKEGYEASALFNDTLANTQRIFVGMSDSANQKILPVLVSILEGIQAVTLWAQDHQDVVTGFFVAASAIITGVYLPAITAAAAATLVAAAPFVLIGAAIAAVSAAIAILYEDVRAYLGGQESYIGNLANKYEWFGKLINAVISGVKFVFSELADFSGEMFDNMSIAANLIGEVFKIVFGQMGIDMESFSAVASTVVDAIIAMFQMMGDAIASTLDFIASPLETTKGVIDSIGSKISGWFGDDDIVQRLEQQSNVALMVSQQANGNPLVASPGYVGNNSNTYINQSNRFSTKVDARGMDREQATQVFGQTMQEQIMAAKGGIDDGVAY